MNSSNRVNISRRGLMFVLSSPSGAGKTTLSKLLRDSDDNLGLSISATTRDPRPGEVEGRDYIFVDHPAFVTMRDQGEFLEWAQVFDNYYATPRKPVELALKQGRDILFDIDWQGAEQLRNTAREDVVTVFVLPPSAKALEERLKNRAQDPPDVVAERMAGASNEIRHWDVYDYVIINEDLDQSLDAIKSILKAERMRRQRRTGLESFVKSIENDLNASKTDES